MTDYIRKEEFDNSDHRFAKFLRDNEWTGDTVATRDMVKFITPEGNPIAIGVYDNTKCRYEVYVYKGAKL